MRTVSHWALALAAAALTFLTVGQASAEDAKTTSTANTLLSDSGSYIPPKTAPQPTPAVGKATPKAKPNAKPHAKAHGKAHPKPHAKEHGKAGPNARAKAKAPKRDKSSRKI